MTFLLILFANAACAFALIAIHETGHFLAGWACGIPMRNMRIRLFTFPQHVVLRDGDEWVAPFDLARYLLIMQRHLGAGARLFAYTAGGLLLETMFTVAASAVAKETGWDGLALMIAGQSLGMYLIFVFLMDLPMALRRGYPWGDVSGMWYIARLPTALLAIGLLVVRVLLLCYVIADLRVAARF
jgi:hypothetical protein